MEEIMNADEVSVYLHVCKKTVYHLAKQGLLPASKVGRGFRFYRSEIDGMLKRSTLNMKHILVIDAVPGICEVIKDALEKDGYMVSIANSGSKAVEFVGEIKFDQIFLDLLMPEKDGLEILRRLRTEDSSVPVTIMTESPSSYIVKNAMEYGVSTILHKPFEIQDILAAISRRDVDRGKKNSVLSNNNSSGIQVAILAGGMATRLGDVSLKLPKSMIRFSDRPFLQYQFELLKDCGINRIVMCLGHLGEQIEDYFKSGNNLGLEISYSYEKKPLGTAGALKNAETLLEDQFFTIYGDSYVFLDFDDVLKYFQSNDRLGLMTVYKNEDRYDRSNTTLNGEFVGSYNKKQKSVDMRHIEYGVNLFKKEVLSQIPENTFFGLEDLFPRLIDAKQLLAYEVKERFYEIGSPKGLDEFSSYIGARKC